MGLTTTNSSSSTTAIVNAVQATLADAGEVLSAKQLVKIINNKVYYADSTPFIFETSIASYVTATLISTNKVLVAYQDEGNSYYGTAVVLTVDGGSITMGTPVVFSSALIQTISCTKIDTDKIILTYYHNSTYGTSVVLSISGTTITVGTPVQFYNGTSDYISCTFIETNKVLVSYRAGSSSGQSIVLTVSGTTITKGTTFTFRSANSQHISSVLIDTNKVLVTYTDGGNSNYGTAVVLSISGTAITNGSAVTFNSATTTSTFATLIDTNKVLVTYSNYSGSGYGTAIVLTISGTVITVGSAVNFNNSIADYQSGVKIDTNKILIAYMDTGNTNYGTAVILTISGTSISVGSPFVFQVGTVSNKSCVLIDTNMVLIARKAGGGGAVLLTINSDGVINKPSGYTVSNSSSENKVYYMPV